jgi:hypothetical protein
MTMKTAALTIALIGTLAVPAFAQWRGGRHGVPPGAMPPPGTCRVWYDGRPAGHQPGPMSCRDAERVAARDPRARVVFGDGRDGWWGGAYPSQRYAGPEYGYPDGRRARWGSGAGYRVGYEDGIDKGREDARDRDRYDPTRHGRYRSADHRYEREYGPKEFYRDAYRQGFLQGYREGYASHRGRGWGW